MALLQTTDLAPGTAGRLLRSAFVPRAIAWVSTRDGEGSPHIAPCFDMMILGRDKPQIGLTFPIDEGLLPAIASDIEEAGAFIVHTVDEAHAHDMAETIAHDDAPLPELATTPGSAIPIPRITGIPIAIECALSEILQPEESDALLVLGTPLAWHIDDRLLTAESTRVDVHRLRPIGSLGGGQYAPVREVFRLDPAP